MEFQTPPRLLRRRRCYQVRRVPFSHLPLTRRDFLHSHPPSPPPSAAPCSSLTGHIFRRRQRPSRHILQFQVVLRKGKTQLFRDGSPMVYSGAIDRIIGRQSPITGDVILVADGTEKPIGWGLYNSVSMFCVRLMQLEDEAARDPSCALNIESRINDAAALRELLELPAPRTNAYHLANSEGDRV